MADPKEKTPKTATDPKGQPPDGGVKVPAGEPKEVPIAAAPEQDDDAGDPSEPVETRQDRKNARSAFRQAEEAREEARKAREEALLAKAQLQSQAMHIEGLRAVLPQAPSQIDQQLEQIGKQQEALLKGWQGRQATLKQGETVSEDEANRTRSEWQKLADQRARIIAQSVSPQAVGPSQQQIQAMIQEAQLRAKYADVYADEGAFAYANALATKYQREGKTGPAAVEEVMQETRRRLGLGKAANGHSQALDAARYGGVPVGAAPMKSTPTHYKMSAAEQKMAHAAWPKLSPEAAEAKWASTTGKKILTKQSRS